MKKTALVLLVIVFTTTLNAQPLKAGLKGGVNITSFTGGDFSNVDKKALVGFHAGGFLTIRLSKISLQPEVLVSTAGAKFENADSSFKLTYLSVPVMVKYRMLGGVYFEIGPQFSFKLDENTGDQTINDFAKNLDLSGALGIGIETKKGLGIGFRYLAGLSKVGDFEASSVSDPDFKNSILQVSISFPLSN